MTPLIPGVAVFAGPRLGTAEFLPLALAALHGGAALDYRIERSSAGQPLVAGMHVSATHLPGRTFVAIAADPIGIDAETDPRIALNTAADDPWLAPAEAAAIAACPTAMRATECGCRWVLKEAYGKAIGRGLGYPLHTLSFAGDVTLAGKRLRGWRFALGRIDDMLIGLCAGNPVTLP